MLSGDPKLIYDHMRLHSGEGKWALVVAVIHWISPYEARKEWVPFREWTHEPGPSEIGRAQWEALADPRYFGLCRVCRGRHIQGHMMGNGICQGCGERYFGVVH